MNGRYTGLGLLILSQLFISGCKSSDEQQNITEDYKAIEELQSVYIQGANTGNLDMFMSVWADDAVRLESDIRSVIGKEKIREHFREPFELYKLQVKVYGEKKIRIDGDLAYSTANFLLSMIPRGTDTTIHTDFKFLEIYERQENGEWKIRIGSAMTNPQWTDDSLSPDLLDQEDASVPKL